MRLFPTITLCLALFSGAVQAQNFGNLFDLDKSTSNFQLGEKTEADVSVRLTPGDKPGVVVFQLTLTIPEGANSYSQAKDFAKPTVIKLSNIDGWTPLDKSFQPNPKPKRSFDEVFNKEVEKLVGTTTFTRRYLAPEGTDIAKARFSGKIEFLLCDKGSCTPKSADFVATLTDDKKVEAANNSDAPAVTLPETPMSESPSEVQSAQATAVTQAQDQPLTFGYELVPQRQVAGEAKDDPVLLQFEMFPADAQPGETVTVAITMQIDPNWSTYGIEKADDSQVETPTRISFSPANLVPVGEIRSLPAPEVHATDLGGTTVRSNAHEGRVTWQQNFKVESSGTYGVTGQIRYQICENRTRCLAPNPVAFSLGESQQPAHVAEAKPVTRSYLALAEESVETDGEQHLSAVTEASETADEALFDVKSEASVTTIWGALGLAFLTGLIMNVMPCVLPVLAIKVLSLVQQAGESRARILGLNFAYTVGVLSVFFVFAILAWGLGQSLASVFQNTTFWIVMACVVFTMGLSLFGVFELPVPGLIPSANDHQEGYFGAFNTGIIATLLGTPCIGPFVVPFFTWTLKQPAPIVFMVFGMMGIGMAAPYLLTGFFPAMVNWLPRPGMWMVRFKQFTGFVLMGTVIWMMFSIPMEWRIPTLILFLAIGLLVWMVHNLGDSTRPIRSQWKVLTASLATTVPIFYVGIAMMQSPAFQSRAAEIVVQAEHVEGGSELAWEPFSEARMIELRKAGTPMLIDFTADWCAICKVNESIALNTESTVEFVQKNQFIPLMADFTRENAEIQKWLKHFGQDSVPLTLIIPPGSGSEIIPLRGQYSKATLLAKLKQAVETSSQAPPQTAQNTTNSPANVR